MTLFPDALRQRLASVTAAQVRDVALFTVALAVAGIPLIILRDLPLAGTTWFVSCIVLLDTLLVVSWAAVTRQASIVPAPNARRLDLISLILFVAFVFAAFYIPMLRHFWVGMDEPVLLGITDLWYDVYDQSGSRPLAASGAWIANQLTPGRIDGYLWLTLVQRGLMGLMLGDVVRLALRHRVQSLGALPAITALLFVVNPSEHLRYLAIFMVVYNGAVFYLLAGLWLFLKSYEHESRLLLSAACLSLGISLLHYESGFPFALIALVLLFTMPTQPHRMAWAYCWVATITLLALRFLLFLLGSASTYQGFYLKAMSQEGMAATLLTNLVAQTVPMFRFFEGTSGIEAFWPLALSAAVLASAIVAMRRSEMSSKVTRKPLLAALAIAILALGLGMSPWLLFRPVQIADFAQDTTLRYQFYTAMPQAVIWAIGIVLVGTVLSPILRMIWTTAATSTLVFLGVIAGCTYQHHNGVLNSYVDYERTVRVFQAVHQAHPTFAPGEVLFFEIDDDEVSPLGWAYHVLHMSCLMFGVPGYQGSYSAERGWIVRTGVGYPIPPTGATDLGFTTAQALNFRRVVSFSLAADGSLQRSSRFDSDHPGARSYVDTCTVEQTQTSPTRPLPFLNVPDAVQRWSFVFK